MVGIYRITSPSGNIYIGQSWNIKTRFRGYKKLSWHGRQPFLFNSFKKYGVETHVFETIHELPSDISQDILDVYEIFYWQQYVDCGFKMMNAKEPGSGGKLTQSTKDKISDKAKGRQLSVETKEKLSKIFKGKKYPEMSERFTGEKNPFYGKKHSDDAKNKIIASKKGKHLGEGNPFYGKSHTDETKKKLSELNKGNVISEYCRKRSSECNKGKPKSEEALKKLSTSLMGHKSWNKGTKEDPEITKKRIGNRRINKALRNGIRHSFGYLN